MRTYTPKREFPYKLPRNVYYDNINDIVGKHVEEMEAKDVLHLLRAGLIDCYFEQNKDAINEGRFDDVIPTLALAAFLTKAIPAGSRCRSFVR